MEFLVESTNPIPVKSFPEMVQFATVALCEKIEAIPAERKSLLLSVRVLLIRSEVSEKYTRMPKILSEHVEFLMVMDLQKYRLTPIVQCVRY